MKKQIITHVVTTVMCILLYLFIADGKDIGFENRCALVSSYICIQFFIAVGFTKTS